MNRNNIFFLVFICFFAFEVHLNGQINTYSPYSIYGIGEMDNSDYGRNSGMGGVGIGLKSTESLNRTNPASYSGIDSLSFILETSIAGRTSYFDNGVTGQTNSVSSLKKLAVGFRVAPFWHTSMGITPFSNMGYDISVEGAVEGASSVSNTSNLTGNGTINRFYLGNSIKLNNKLSVGVNLSFLFGTLTQDENNILESTSITSVSTKSYLHTINFDYGFQYSSVLNNGWNYTLGGIFGFKNKMKRNHTSSFASNSGEVDIVKENVVNYFTLPMFAGVGFSIKNKTGFTLAADYIFQKWSGNKPTKVISYEDCNKIALGIEYTPAVGVPKNYFQKMFYQAGFNYNETYLKLRGTQINQMGASVGVGLPIKFEKSYLSISFETGTKGKVGNDLVRETYNQINVTVVLKDIWFQKSKYE